MGILFALVKRFLFGGFMQGILFSDLPFSAHQSEEAMVDFAFSCLPRAAALAKVPYSNFRVGAVAIDALGNFYFGANQEYESFLAQTVHAEQSALANAWTSGALSLRHIVVNYTPCGHCRQFLMEVAGASDLLVHTPHSRFKPLSFYLPEAFSADDLEIEERIFRKFKWDLKMPDVVGKDEVFASAWQALLHSHAPYSKRPAGAAVALSNGQVFWGSYLESAAFNPSLPALQVALNGVHLSGFSAKDVVRAVVIAPKDSGHCAQAETLWQAYCQALLEFVALN